MIAGPIGYIKMKIRSFSVNSNIPTIKLNFLLWKYCPLFLLILLIYFFGSLRGKEKLGLLQRPHYAYGLLSAVDLAIKVGVKSIYALEFGVANGRGLRNLVSLSQQIQNIAGVNIKVVGFDTGKGMPRSNDYRDHPEKYKEGDYPMTDQKKLIQYLKGNGQLILGDIAKTIDDFTNNLDESCPVGFIAVDVDTYNSSVSVLKLFNSDNAKNFLPMVFSYFDDSGSRSHFNKFAGELLAIEDFNQNNLKRKIDIDRGVWNSHRRIGLQLWFERMYITHIFDHPWRKKRNSRSNKIIH